MPGNSLLVEVSQYWKKKKKKSPADVRSSNHFEIMNIDFGLLGLIFGSINYKKEVNIKSSALLCMYARNVGLEILPRVGTLTITLSLALSLTASQ